MKREKKYIMKRKRGRNIKRKRDRKGKRKRKKGVELEIERKKEAFDANYVYETMRTENYFHNEYSLKAFRMES